MYENVAYNQSVIGCLMDLFGKFFQPKSVAPYKTNLVWKTSEMALKQNMLPHVLFGKDHNLQRFLWTSIPSNKGMCKEIEECTSLPNKNNVQNKRDTLIDKITANC